MKISAAAGNPLPRVTGGARVAGWRRLWGVMACLLCLPAAAGAQTYRELSERAIECIECDSLPQAEELLLQALKLEPANGKNVFLFSDLGLVQRRLGEYGKAVDSYSYALNFAPSSVPILLDRAALYLETGQNDRACEDYSLVLEKNADNEEALLFRAYIYVLRQDYPSARKDYEHLLEIDPDHYNGRLGLVELNRKEGKYRDALAMLDRMVADTPGDATLFLVRAGIELETGHEDLALVDVGETLRLDGSSAEAYLLRGDIYLVQEKKALARSDFEKAVSLGVSSADVYERLKLCK